MNEKELVDKILEREKETLPVMLVTLTEYEAIEALLETLKVAIYKDGFYRKDGKHRVIRHEDYVRLSDVLNGTDMPELNTAIVMRGKKEVGSEMNKFIGEWAQEADKIRISLKNRGAKLAAFIHEAVEASKKIERVKGMIEKEIYPTLSNKYPHFSINDIV